MIKTTLGDASYLSALKRIESLLAPGGNWTEANKRAAEWDRQDRVENAKHRYTQFLKRGGLERFSEKIAKLEVTGSKEHQRFISEYLVGFEKVFNRRAPGMFVAGDTGIGKTYNATLFSKNAMWAKDFTRKVKTEWAGKVCEYDAPATVLYLTSMALIDRMDKAKSWSSQETRESALSEICSYDIVIIDDVGMPASVGKTNAEVGAINALVKAMPTGLILQTRLPFQAFKELFGDSVGDIVSRYYKPTTIGCQSRRVWEAPK